MKPESVKSGKVVPMESSGGRMSCEILHVEGDWGVCVQRCRDLVDSTRVYMFHNHIKASGVWTIGWQTASSRGCGCGAKDPPKRAVELAKLMEVT